ncbi:MAG: hypothetical protein ACRD4C_02420 [Candidatus Acidiferrales bacterium]
MLNWPGSSELCGNFEWYRINQDCRAILGVNSSFHEKAGKSQSDFGFTYGESLPLSQAASDANFRATATTARFFAFLPPRSAASFTGGADRFPR